MRNIYQEIDHHLLTDAQPAPKQWWSSPAKSSNF